MKLEYTTVSYPAGYERRKLNIFDIYAAVSQFIKVENMDTKCRKKHLVYARHLYCFLSRKQTSATWKEISNLIGGRDHTTAIHGVNKLQDLYDTEEGVRVDVAAIRDILNRTIDNVQFAKDHAAVVENR